ncbi:MAG: hypothetical protein V7K48_09090 [Nostoc sp.]|uniref:hypothetical protein n=1 Tax=Nostoc sp. TaxID=1180 RepID=UPI002FFB9050
MAIENVNKPTTGAIASIINLMVLLFAAFGVFAQLQDALNTIWSSTAKTRTRCHQNH